MMKKIMARGEVLTKSFERKRLTGLSANAANLDSPPITDHLLVSHSPAKGQGRITDHLYRGAVSSVVEHYLDTVGVTGSNPVSRTICNPFENSDSIIMSTPASERSTFERHISV